MKNLIRSATLMAPLVAAFVALAAPSPVTADDVHITYWQYFYQSKVDLVNELIPQFEAQNPGIKVDQVTFPYENYNQKLASAVAAGEGPDVVNLYYGWLPTYVKAGYLQPLPKDFDKAYFTKNAYPFVEESARFDGKYYAAPTAVRTLALVWNKDLFKKAGLNPDVAPKTLEELASFAKKLAVFDAQGNLVQAGLALQPNAQGHAWIREVLVRQFGGVPYSTDNKTPTYDSAAGVAAFTWYTDLIVKDKVGFPNFGTDDSTAFIAGKAAINIDGSFRVAALNKNPDLHWGVAELPTYKGVKGNFASYWTHGITTSVTGKKLDAAAKWLKFLTSAEVQQKWLKAVGELPATPTLSAQYKDDPIVSVFLKGLPYAKATAYVDEAGQRKVLVDAVDEVVQTGKAPAAALKDAAAKEKKLIADFWAK